jgi:hypothetical protein
MRTFRLERVDASKMSPPYHVKLCYCYAFQFQAGSSSLVLPSAQHSLRSDVSSCRTSFAYDRQGVEAMWGC